jgi:hypothetical protein
MCAPLFQQQHPAGSYRAATLRLQKTLTGDVTRATWSWSVTPHALDTLLGRRHKAKRGQFPSWKPLTCSGEASMLMTATARRCSMPSRSSRRRCTSVTAGSAAPGRSPRPTEKGGYSACGRSQPAVRQCNATTDAEA